MAPKPGHKNMPRPEKQQHVQNLNDVLADALNNWNPGDNPNVILQFEVSVSPNPGGVSQYRCRFVPGPPPE